VFSTLKAKLSKQGHAVDFLDPDFQEGADTLPRLALTHIAQSQTNSCFPSCMTPSLHQATCQKTREGKKNLPRSDQAREKLLQLAFVFLFSRRIKKLKNGGS
jgi:hypothetical protein